MVHFPLLYIYDRGNDNDDGRTDQNLHLNIFILTNTLFIAFYGSVEVLYVHVFSYLCRNWNFIASPLIK